MGAKDFAARGEDNVSASMMSLQLGTSFLVHRALDDFAFNVFYDLAVDLMKHHSTHLDHINDFELSFNALYRENTDVVDLTSRGGVKRAFF